MHAHTLTNVIRYFCMSKKFFGAVSLLSLSTLIISGALAVSYNTGFEKAEAYSTSSLPTTINLNDCDDNVIQNYYSSLDGKVVSERQGNNLLKNLKTILKNGQQYYSYDSSNGQIWNAYAIVDRDWEHSPAEEITSGTYNSATKTITGYSYGQSHDNPYLHALYYNRDKESIAQAFGDHSNSTSVGINREHIWPKGAGFTTSGEGGARGDLMHLWAAHGYTNNIHSNLYYGNVDKNQSYTDIGSTYSMCSGNLKGESATLGSGTVFEPQDSDKGDIARAVFYMVARYNYISGSDADGIDQNNPNLELVNNVSSFSSKGYDSTTSTTGKLGILQDLLEWNRLDPPDEFEIHRNNILYRNYTKNRNPFIDYPEWAEYIWGKTTDGVYSSASTGYATPSSDPINDFKTGGKPTVESVQITPSTLALDLNGSTSGNLSVNVTVTHDASQTVTWSSNKTSVATVNNSGVVTAVGIGSATITARSTFDQTKYGTCTITVTGSSSQGDNDTISFIRSSETNTVSDGYSLVITNGSAKTGYYQDKSASEGLDISLKKTSGTIWTTSPTTITATVKIGGGATRDPLNNNVVAYFLDGNGNTINASQTIVTTKVEEKTGKDYTFTMPATNNVSGILIHHEKETSYNVRLYSISLSYSSEALVPTSIEATVDRSFKVGETISKSNITVTDNFDNIINDFVFSNDGYQFKYSDTLSGGGVGQVEFPISYLGLNTNVSVSVSRFSYVSPADVIKTLSAGDDEEDSDFAGISGTSYSNAVDNTITKDGITYMATETYNFRGMLSFKTTKIADNVYSTNSVLYNDTKFETSIKSVEYELGGTRVVNIDPTIEYSNDKVHWSEDNSGNNYYFRFSFVGTFYGYINFSNVIITLRGPETANSLANYIMFEDTENQCNTKLDSALDIFEQLSIGDRALFMTSDNYVIATARERLEAWCRNQGKTITYVNGDYVVNGTNARFNYLITSNNVWMIVLISISVTSLSGIVIYLVSKKKRKMH